MRRARRSTPPGGHLPVLLDAVLAALNPQPGDTVVDCTLGGAGHSVELLRRAGHAGRLIALDLDPVNLPPAREKLAAIGDNFTLHHANFAALPTVLAGEPVDAILADLGMSSMQVDDAERGFSYVRDGPLDMRMDPTRGKSAAQVLATISQTDLAAALRELGDEPAADEIARILIEARERAALNRTGEVGRAIVEGLKTGPWRLHPMPGKWNLHPAARTFQALRILVNRELASLEQLLRMLPTMLKPGARVAIISFHSGEDRLVKAAFKAGRHAGTYTAISDEPVRPTFQERTANPRSRSAKLRWARRGKLEKEPRNC